MDRELLARVTVPLRDFVLDVELGVDAGATVAVTGLSGSGKTTLLRALAGLIRPTGGRIVAAGDVWFDAATGVFLPVELRPIGLVFQDYALFPHLDARANVAFPLESAGVSRAERRRRADELLARLEIPHLATSKPATLSGGERQRVAIERQRVAIARALARQPRLLLLDEPLSSLDPATRGRVTGELQTLLQHLELATVIVTHSYDDAAALASRVAVIDRGQIVQEGTPEDLLAAPNSAFVADFAGVNYLNGVASEGPHGLTLVSFEGGSLLTTEVAEGPVGVVIPPWVITLAGEGGSARNSLAGNVVRVVRLGNRVRVTVATPRSVTAEISTLAADELDLRPGRPVTLRFKATECRLTRGAHTPRTQA